MEINRTTLAALFTGYNTAYQGAFTGVTPEHSQIALTVPSTTSKESYPWLGQTTGFREWVGDRVVQNLSLHDYTIKNRTFENTVGVPREAIEDDSYGVYTPLAAQLGQDAAQHPDLLSFGLLADGFTQKCFDGQPFFDADHPVKRDGKEVSVSNTQGGAEAPWFLLDTTRVIKPILLQKRRDYKFTSLTDDKDENVFMRKEYVYGVDARLNVGFGLWQLAFASRQSLGNDTFDDAFARMSGQKGDHGRPLGIRPKLLVVPPSLRSKALEVVKAATRANGATNTNRDVVDVLVTPWLA
ncbi:Phage major capsid protein [plant metagenome]|uniref:Phage major capsid protein n=1 Tax=plant metagenome TaxID=1297885 RepID=A0A484Q884_9ZZZZ